MYLVDGNNVMGQRVGWHRDKPAAVRRLLGELAAFMQRHRDAVVVVFDHRTDGLTDGDTLAGVRVHFARTGSTADDRMVEIAREKPPGEVREAIVAVTSDRDLLRRLEELGLRTMRSGRFRRMLEEPEERT